MIPTNKFRTGAAWHAFSVALIGADGAGKTTIAKMLESAFPLPVKRLYMGVSVESSNFALPTSRLVHALKRDQREPSPERKIAARSPLRRALKSVRACLRLANRLAEEWYRQLLAMKFVRQGNVVVYDRHFRFDFERGAGERLTDRFHRWCLAKMYPLPDLVIFLDAPAEVLFARKKEWTLEWLQSRRQAFLALADSVPNFQMVDATQPIEAVYRQVASQIFDFHHARQHEGQKSLATRAAH